MKRAARLFSSALLALLMPSAVAFPSQKGFYLDVPYVHQVKNYCGPEALAMVLRYWDLPVDQHELARYFRPFPRKGVSGAQLKELAAEYGFSAYSFPGTVRGST